MKQENAYQFVYVRAPRLMEDAPWLNTDEKAVVDVQGRYRQYSQQGASDLQARYNTTSEVRGEGDYFSRDSTSRGVLAQRRAISDLGNTLPADRHHHKLKKLLGSEILDAFSAPSGRLTTLWRDYLALSLSPGLHVGERNDALFLLRLLEGLEAEKQRKQDTPLKQLVEKTPVQLPVELQALRGPSVPQRAVSSPSQEDRSTKQRERLRHLQDLERTRVGLEAIVERRLANARKQLTDASRKTKVQLAELQSNSTKQSPEGYPVPVGVEPPEVLLPWAALTLEEAEREENVSAYVGHRIDEQAPLTTLLSRLEHDLAEAYREAKGGK